MVQPFEIWYVFLYNIVPCNPRNTNSHFYTVLASLSIIQERLSIFSKSNLFQISANQCEQKS